MPHIVSVNVSLPKTVAVEGRTVLSGIFKEPVPGSVAITRRNLDGDRQADLRVHGGPDKAVYAYPNEHYPRWSEELGRSDLAPGQFGENLTVDGLEESHVLIGERLRIGTALLEVSQPRIPCFKLGIRMGDPAFPKRFIASERCGFYLRVIEEGAVASGDAVESESRPEDSVTIHDVFAQFFARDRDASRDPQLCENPWLAGAWKDGIRQRA